MKYVLDIPTILVDRKGEKRRLRRGDDVSDIDPDQLVAMLRLGQAVEYVPPVEPDSPDCELEDKEENDTDSNTEQGESSDDWLTTPVEQLDIDAGTVKALLDAKLQTVSDVLEYGRDHNSSLAALDGIAEGREKSIQAAIEKVAGA